MKGIKHNFISYGQMRIFIFRHYLPVLGVGYLPPAAFLGCGSHFSASLSGIEPWFPVTRYNHGRRKAYHRQLIRQIFERCIAGSETVRSTSIYSESPRQTAAWPADWFWSNKSVASGAGQDSVACISSRITTVIQVSVHHLRNHSWFNEPFAVSP